MGREVVDPAELKIEQIYIVAGRGPMKLIEISEKMGGSFKMQTPGGRTYWASAEQIYREADRNYLETHADQLQAAFSGKVHESVRTIKRWAESA